MHIPYLEGLGQRGYADLIEKEVSSSYEVYTQDERYHPARSKRSVEDFSIQNRFTGYKHWYDVKSIDLGAEFSMPNLISVDRLKKILKDPLQELTYINVYYSVDHDKKVVDIFDERRYNITEIDHSVLAIQNLGLGILQLKNAKDEIPLFYGSQEEWEDEFDKMCYAFYGKQVKKFMMLQEKFA